MKPIWGRGAEAICRLPIQFSTSNFNELRLAMDSRTVRKARQMVETDRAFGMDFVPVRERSSVAQEVVQVQIAVAAQPPDPQRVIARTDLSREQKAASLAELARQTEEWVRAHWPRDGWNRFVFGEGDPAAQLMFVGEGPGAEEDAQGRPFVGAAGKLLDRQIIAMGLAREAVYIANIAKTRPPGNRVPTPQEAERWMPWLERQIEIICPRVIIALGATASKYLLNDPKLAITRQRGQWCSFRGIDLMCTFHPAFLLRSYTVENRRRVWEDLCKVLQRLGLEPPKREPSAP